MTYDELIERFIIEDSSDLHIAADSPPYIRKHGKLIPLSGMEPLSATEIESLTLEMVGQEKFDVFMKTNELDMAISVAGGRRIRVNVYRQQKTISWALRLLPAEFFPLDKLGIDPDICKMVCGLHKGLVLVTGATGSGKSTTLASIIDEINTTRHEHIFTIEDPVEYKHYPKQSFISQREVGDDTESFGEALKRVLREDPDVILIGEMRDRETMEAALTLAETGHLTFGTLHTSEAVQTITRIIGAFPPEQQNQIRTQLAASLKVVFSQQLVPWEDGNGRSLASEIMVATPAVQSMIRDNKIHQLNSALQTGGSLGMTTMNQSLLELYNLGKISKEMALSRSLDKDDMERKLNM